MRLTEVPPVKHDPAMNAMSADHDAFLALVESHRRPLHKVCWAYGRSPHDRDDLLQEIVGQLWSSFPKYDRSRPFLTWMYRIALNVAIDFQRRRLRWNRESTSLSEREHSIPADEPSHELRELLELLDDADRAILVLYLESRSYREIGEILGISESNVGTRLNRIKNALRETENEPTNYEGE